MSNSQFPFVDNSILRQNLDQAFQHIIVLLALSESNDYNEEAKSAFRKTIIIYTASIIEALLFYIVDSQLDDNDLTTYSWKLQNKKVLFSVNDDHEIVAGDYKRISEIGDKEKLNLGQLNSLLKEKPLLPASLYNKIDAIRKLRNEQHLGTHIVVKTYSKEDLEKAFDVARAVKNLAATLIF